MPDNTEAERIAQKCITSEARKCAGRLPFNSKYEYDDLVQEGWIVYWRIITTKRIRWEGSQFPGLLRLSLKRKYKNIEREENRLSRSQLSYQANAGEDTLDQSSDPERLAQVIEAVGAIREVNNDLAYYLIFGLDETEFGFLRYLQRQRKQCRWTMNGMRYRWTPENVKLFFNFDTASLRLGEYI